jgi:hypothetical protein
MAWKGTCERRTGDSADLSAFGVIEAENAKKSRLGTDTH